MEVGDRIKDKDEPENEGVITELYRGQKADMKDRVKVDWGEGFWTWERRENLELIP